MTTLFRFLLALLIASLIALPELLLIARDSVSIYLFIIAFISPFFTGLITLYSDEGRVTVKLPNGMLEPIYEERVRKRSFWGNLLFGSGIMCFLIIASIGATGVVYSDYLLLPLVPVIGIGSYFLVTPRCPYCFRANRPNSETCENCDSDLPDMSSLFG